MNRAIPFHPGPIMALDSIEGVDWKAWIANTNWQKLVSDRARLAGSVDAIPTLEGAVVFNLGLSISVSDWAVLMHSCKERVAQSVLESDRYGILRGNFLVLIQESSGECSAVIRFAVVEDEILAAEALLPGADFSDEVDVERRDQIQQLELEYRVIRPLDDLLPGCRCGYRRVKGADRWYWREQTDPAYFNVAWMYFDPVLMEGDLSRVEWVSLESQEEMDQGFGFKAWSERDLSVLRNFADICPSYSGWGFLYCNPSPLTGDESLLVFCDSRVWAFSIPIQRSGQTVRSARILVNLEFLNEGRDSAPEETIAAYHTPRSAVVVMLLELSKMLEQRAAHLSGMTAKSIRDMKLLVEYGQRCRKARYHDYPRL